LIQPVNSNFHSEDCKHMYHISGFQIHENYRLKFTYRQKTRMGPKNIDLTVR